MAGQSRETRRKLQKKQDHSREPTTSTPKIPTLNLQDEIQKHQNPIQARQLLHLQTEHDARIQKFGKRKENTDSIRLPTPLLPTY